MASRASTKGAQLPDMGLGYIVLSPEVFRRPHANSCSPGPRAKEEVDPHAAYTTKQPPVITDKDTYIHYQDHFERGLRRHIHSELT